MPQSTTVSAPRTRVRDHHAMVLLAISAGGVIGAVARYGLTEAFPHSPRGMPWATFGVNAAGCLLIGVLMPLVTDVWAGQRLLRPFLGVGVLGGFTTFSTYVVDVQQAASAGAPGVAVGYLGATVLTALVAVFVGVTVTRWVVRRG